MTSYTNHGVYTDTQWAVPVIFANAAGTALDMSGHDYACEVLDDGGDVLFSFLSTGGGATDGTIGTDSADAGQLDFEATVAQHAALTAGTYRVHLTRTPSGEDPVWVAEGRITVGSPGATNTGIVFDRVSSSTATTALPIVLERSAIPDADILTKNVSSNLTKGFTSTGYPAGIKSSGAFTPDPANGNIQVATNGGAHTLAPPTTGSGDAASMVILYTNNASAGSITTSGFTFVDGDTLTTTDGHNFMLFIMVIGGLSLLTVKALQ